MKRGDYSIAHWWDRREGRDVIADSFTKVLFSAALSRVCPACQSCRTSTASGRIRPRWYRVTLLTKAATVASVEL